jgi:CRP-like cAMP-binding protein
VREREREREKREREGGREREREQATVRATSPGSVWALDRDTFTRVMIIGGRQVPPPSLRISAS